MISDADQDEITRKFNVYEHEWRFFAPFTGEPFLIDGRFIAYFDGSVANICLFGLDGRSVDAAGLVELIEQLPFAQEIELLQIWGHFEPPNTGLHDPRLYLIDSEMLRIDHGSEFTTNLETFDVDHLSDARKSLKKSLVRGIRTSSKQITFLQSEHLKIIQEWAGTHAVAPVSVLAVASLGHYCSQSHVHIVEARLGRELVGFNILSRPAPGRAVNMLSFGRRLPGMHIGDALAHEAIVVARRLGAATLHNGYAGTAQLADFKRKWGAEQHSPPYRHAIYSVAGQWPARASSGNFHWPLRLRIQET